MKVEQFATVIPLLPFDTHHIKLAKYCCATLGR